MKKNLALLAALMIAAAGCESWSGDRDDSGTMNEPAGAQSESSDVNQSSSSRNVGQSGTSTNEYDAAPANNNNLDNQNQAPQNNSPQ